MTGLVRFKNAQAPVYSKALAELRAGLKRGHWMWFVFPQLRGLGHSHNAQHYGIDDLDEAREYLADPVLGPRLTECARAVLLHRGRASESILGSVDAMKLRSSATLFREAGRGPEFQALLDAFYGGEECALTISALHANHEDD